LFLHFIYQQVLSLSTSSLSSLDLFKKQNTTKNLSLSLHLFLFHRWGVVGHGVGR
jgi:hypothetical protein